MTQVIDASLLQFVLLLITNDRCPMLVNVIVQEEEEEEEEGEEEVGYHHNLLYLTWQISM